MTSPIFNFHPRAEAEARKALRWYARRSPATARRFIAELLRALAEIANYPDRWATHLHGTRVFHLNRFPYFVVYRVGSSFPLIVAVMHGRRRPGYWRKRLP